MKAPLDVYTIRARLVPAIIAGAPAFAFAAAFISWGNLGLTQLVAGSGLTVLLAVFADVARRRGRAIEPGLIARMGGLASTVTLRHRDATYDAKTKAQFHNFFSARLGAPAPTPEEEKADPDAADAYYVQAATWLRENTRNAKKFDILFNESISYGFRRNLLGLKMPALILNAVIVATCAWQAGTSNLLESRLLPVIVVAVLHAAYLALFVTERSVIEAARAYARQLLLSIHAPDFAKMPKAPPTARATRPRARAKKA